MPMPAEQCAGAVPARGCEEHALAWSHPLMTSPAPIWNENGCLRKPREESKTEGDGVGVRLGCGARRPSTAEGEPSGKEQCRGCWAHARRGLWTRGLTGAVHQPAGVVRLHYLARLRIRLPIARLGRLDRDAHERRSRRPRRDSRRGGWRDQPHGRRDQRAGGDEEGEHGSAEREVSTRCAKLRIQ